MKKKIQLLAVICCTVLLIPGCVVNRGTKIYNSDEMIVKDYNSYNLVMSRQSVSENHLTGSAQTMEGMGEIWEFDAPKDLDVKIESQITVSSGKAKLVLIDPDDTVTILKEYTADSKAEQKYSETFRVKKGHNRMKLVAGKDTQIEFDISVDQGEMNTFGD